MMLLLNNKEEVLPHVAVGSYCIKGLILIIIFSEKMYQFTTKCYHITEG